MKTKLLTICLLLFTSQVFSSNGLLDSGKKLYCKSKNEEILATYNFISSLRYEKFEYYTMVSIYPYDAFDYGRHYYKQTGNYVAEERGKYETYLVNSLRFIKFGLDYEYYIYESQKNFQEPERLERDVDDHSQLTEFLERETLKIYSSLSHYRKGHWNFSCNLFDGTKEDLINKAEKEHSEIHKKKKKQLWEWNLQWKKKDRKQKEQYIQKLKEQQILKNKI